MKNICMALSLIVLTVATSASASITGYAGGTAAPGATLGPYTMTPFGDDGGLVGLSVTSVLSPLTGQVDFSIPLIHEEVGDGWATWSHGYTGDVYRTGSATSVTLTLPDYTTAFYLYAEPDMFVTYTIGAVAQDGTPISQSVNGFQGASYYGFYGTDGSFIHTVTVTTGNSSDNFAIGEFGIAAGSPPVPVVPAPAGIFLVTLGSAVVGHLRRRRML
jgi:hypothetical protein